MECRNVTQHVVENKWKNVLGKQYENKFVVHNALKMENEVRYEIGTKHEVEDTMIKMRLYVVSDIYLKNNKM